MLPVSPSAPFGALDITVAAVLSLPSPPGSVAILEHQPQAELKIAILAIFMLLSSLVAETLSAGGSAPVTMPFLFLRELLNHFQCFKPGQRAWQWIENRPKCKLPPKAFHNLLLQADRCLCT